MTASEDSAPVSEAAILPPEYARVPDRSTVPPSTGTPVTARVAVRSEPVRSVLDTLATVTVKVPVIPLSLLAEADRLNDFAASSMVNVAPANVRVCVPIGRVIGRAGAPTATVSVEPERVPVTGPSGRVMFSPARKLFTAAETVKEVDGAAGEGAAWVVDTGAGALVVVGLAGAVLAVMG